MKRRQKIALLSLLTYLLFLALTAIIGNRAQPLSRPVSAEVSASDTLLIDPGHGGLDGGAVAADGTLESAINLAISLRLRDLCRLWGVPCSMTRTEESLAYPEHLGSIHEKKVWDQQRRLAMTKTECDPVLLSIHQNFYPDPRPSGVQVLYAGAAGSELLGAIAHDNLIQWLCPDCRRVCMPAEKSIYLMQQVQCPAILVECGFLSNPVEASQLNTSAYQTKIAAILLASYLQYEQALTAA